MTKHIPMAELRDAQDLDARFHILDVVTGLLGVKAALQLSEARGGTKIYMPAHIPEGHWLASLLGLEEARLLARTIMPAQVGGHVDIPLSPSRWMLLHELIDKGLPTMEIARACKVTARTVRRHRNEREEQPRIRAHLAQLGLFD